MRRKSELTGADLTVSEILMLQAASNPDGVHGYALRETLGTDQVKNGAMYRRLGALADRGYLTSHIESEESADSHAGAIRKLYNITEDGRQLLTNAMQLLGVVAAEVEPQQ